MKKAFLFLMILMVLFARNIQAQSETNISKSPEPNSIGIVIYSDDVETVWNAIRFSNFSINQGDTVSIFLLGKGVELDNLVEVDTNIKEQTNAFLEAGGTILGCGTCLRSRNNDEPQICKFASMKDLYELVRKNKIVLTF